jgi:septal ring factor EnvC (AmiA/AmiB activator)
LKAKQGELDENKGKLQREKENNSELSDNIESQERVLTKLRETLTRSESDRKNLEGEVAILRN